MKKRNLALILALVMLLTACVAGTLAWLTDKTQSVENVFTVGNIDITLTETDADNDGNANTNSYKMVPGNTISKDPKVTVKAGSEACYVFVKIEGSTNPKFDDYMTYDVAEGWTALNDADNDGIADDGVYYREQADLTAEGATDAVYSVLNGDKVTVKTDVTKEMMDELQAAYDKATEDKDKTLPQLTFTAYAIQSANLTDQNADGSVNAVDAWRLINGATPDPGPSDPPATP